jgi:hypothetical protein
MAASRIPGPATEIFVAPDDWMVISTLTPCVSGLVKHRKHVNLPPRIGAKVVPTVASNPVFGRSCHRGMTRIHYSDRGLLHGWMILEVSSDKLSIPGPFIPGVGCRMDAKKTSSPPGRSARRLVDTTPHRISP